MSVLIRTFKCKKCRLCAKKDLKSSYVLSCSAGISTRSFYRSERFSSAQLHASTSSPEGHALPSSSPIISSFSVTNACPAHICTT